MPIEIPVKIFSYLELLDLVALRAVNKKCHAAVALTYLNVHPAIDVELSEEHIEIAEEQVHASPGPEIKTIYKMCYGDLINSYLFPIENAPLTELIEKRKNISYYKAEITQIDKQIYNKYSDLMHGQDWNNECLAWGGLISATICFTGSAGGLVWATHAMGGCSTLCAYPIDPCFLATDGCLGLLSAFSGAFTVGGINEVRHNPRLSNLHILENKKATLQTSMTQASKEEKKLRQACFSFFVASSTGQDVYLTRSLPELEENQKISNPIIAL
jgi:hypothetical protein